MTLFLLLFVTFLIVLGLTPLVFLFGKNAIPNERSSHTKPTPTGGGAAIILGFLISVFIVFSSVSIIHATTSTFYSVVGVVLVSAVGLWDDLKDGGVSYKTRLVAQSIGIILLLQAFWYLQPASIAKILFCVGAFGWMLFLVNACNFMDGLNGLLLLSVCVILVGFMCGISASPKVIMMSLLLSSACLGFLPYNFPKAFVFLGDCGSTTLGLLLGFMTVLTCSDVPQSQLLTTTLRVILPFGFIMGDVCFTLLRRLFLKRPLTEAHRDHLFQLLHRSGIPHAPISLLYATLSGVVILSLLYGSVTLDMLIYMLLQGLLLWGVRWITKVRNVAW